MASIKGVSLKAIKTFEGFEGTGFSANIYIYGKKFGSVVDSAHGGQMEFSFTSKDAEKLFLARVKEYVDDYPEDDVEYLYRLNAVRYRLEKDAGTIPKRKLSFEVQDVFISRLFSLSMYEKMYKKAKKEGYDGIAVFMHPWIQGVLIPSRTIRCLERESQAEDDLRMLREASIAYDLEYLFCKPEDFELL